METWSSEISGWSMRWLWFFMGLKVGNLRKSKEEEEERERERERGINEVLMREREGFFFWFYPCM